MLALFMNWLTPGERTPQLTLAAATPAPSVAYSETLLDELKQDHRDLLRLFRTTVEMHGKKDCDNAWQGLKRFVYVWRVHAQKENLQLYTYLRQCLDNDARSIAEINALRNDAVLIGRALSDCVARYEGMAWSIDMRQRFGEELGALDKTLAMRFMKEESDLFSMYRQPSEYW
jgi:hypothetical protein